MDPVNQVSHTKSLGVLIDENLSWNIPINKLIEKIASSIVAIKRVSTKAFCSTYDPAVHLQFVSATAF